MDILISANQMVLDIVRSVPHELRENMDEEKFKTWYEQINKAGADGEKLQKITV